MSSVGDRWREIDIGMMENPPIHLTADDHCVYAREYTPRKPYTHSEANQLIFNLRIRLDHRGTRRWYHKEQAAAQFAREVSQLLRIGSCVMFVPTSKRRDDPEFDPRLDMVESALASRRKDLVILRPIVREVSRVGSHTLGGRRTVADILEGLRWDKIDDRIQHIAVIDDMLTMGTSYRAVSQMFEENAPNVILHGVFWTLARYDKDDDLSFLDSDFFNTTF